mgnify:CR=1 FL=1
MGIFDTLKKKLTPPGKKKPIAEVAKKQTKSAKEIATEKGEPYVSILSMDIDPNNMQNGAFELDWNEKFITNLVRAGYKGKTDADMVDQWFQDVCKNVVQENYEQWEANQPVGERPRTINRRDLGDGKTEVS